MPHAEEEWDASRGIGDWKARLERFNEWAERAAEHGESSDEDEDEDDGRDLPDGAQAALMAMHQASEADHVEATGNAVDSKVAGGFLDTRPDSELSDAELIKRHPWLTE